MDEKTQAAALAVAYCFGLKVLLDASSRAAELDHLFLRTIPDATSEQREIALEAARLLLDLSPSESEQSHRHPAWERVVSRICVHSDFGPPGSLAALRHLGIVRWSDAVELESDTREILLGLLFPDSHASRSKSIRKMIRAAEASIDDGAPSDWDYARLLGDLSDAISGAIQRQQLAVLTTTGITDRLSRPGRR